MDIILVQISLNLNRTNKLFSPSSSIPPQNEEGELEIGKLGFFFEFYNFPNAIYFMMMLLPFLDVE